MSGKDKTGTEEVEYLDLSVTFVLTNKYHALICIIAVKTVSESMLICPES